jgi:hypothetical protein
VVLQEAIIVAVIHNANLVPKDHKESKVNKHRLLNNYSSYLKYKLPCKIVGEFFYELKFK